MGFIVIHHLFISVQYNRVQYHIVVIVYDNKCHRTIPQYNMTYSVVHKNVMML